MGCTFTFYCLSVLFSYLDGKVQRKAILCSGRFLTIYNAEVYNKFLLKLRCITHENIIQKYIEIRTIVCWNIILKYVFRMLIFWQSSIWRTFIMSQRTCQVGMQNVMHQCVVEVIKACHRDLKQKLVTGAHTLAMHPGMFLMTQWSKLRKLIR